MQTSFKMGLGKIWLAPISISPAAEVRTAVQELHLAIEHAAQRFARREDLAVKARSISSRNASSSRTRWRRKPEQISGIT